MAPRIIALLTILPLLALEPAFTNAAGASETLTDPQIEQQLAEAQRLARQAGDDLVRSLELFAATIPTYGVPFVDGSGNIVIPRTNRPAARGTPIPEAKPGQI